MHCSVTLPGRIAWSACLVGAVLAACTDTEVPLSPDEGPTTVRIAVAEHGGLWMGTRMTQEIHLPTPADPDGYHGDPDGEGFAEIILNSGQEEVCFRVEVSDILLPAIASHIHRGLPGAPGPVVVPLSAPDASGVATGCVPANRDLVKDIRAHPENYYVNVHTTDFVPGAVRGQLGG